MNSSKSSGHVSSDSNIAATGGRYWPMNPVPVATVRSMPTPVSFARCHCPQPLYSDDSAPGRNGCE